MKEGGKKAEARGKRHQEGDVMERLWKDYGMVMEQLWNMAAGWNLGADSVSGKKLYSFMHMCAQRVL